MPSASTVRPGREVTFAVKRQNCCVIIEKALDDLLLDDMKFHAYRGSGTWQVVGDVLSQGSFVLRREDIDELTHTTGRRLKRFQGGLFSWHAMSSW